MPLFVLKYTFTGGWLACWINRKCPAELRLELELSLAICAELCAFKLKLTNVRSTKSSILVLESTDVHCRYAWFQYAHNMVLLIFFLKNTEHLHGILSTHVLNYTYSWPHIPRALCSTLVVLVLFFWKHRTFAWSPLGVAKSAFLGFQLKNLLKEVLDTNFLPLHMIILSLIIVCS